MSVPHLPSDVLAADAMSAYVQPIAVGDYFRGFSLHDESGRLFNIDDDYVAGAWLALILVRDFESAEARRELAAYAARAECFERLRVKPIVISTTADAAANRAIKARLGLAFPILGDVVGAAFAACGLRKRCDAASPSPLRSVILSPLRQVRSVWDAGQVNGHAERAETMVRDARMAEELRWAPPHAPVLAVPQVFSKEECADIISMFESEAPLKVQRAAFGSVEDFKLPVYEYGRTDRVDHVIKSPAHAGFIDARMKERVFPMVKHAFAFDVTRREDLHIARYVGPRNGIDIGHRDNRLTTQHRRFALSLNLNDDYDGGAVVFREFSNRGYKSPPGTALVFSSSLLHEVEETTRGVRYTLISHFFNEASLKEAQAR
jgi:peroxiredoxin